MSRRPPRSPSTASARRRLGVVLVDPMPVVRAGLRLLIDDRPDMEVVGDVGTVDEALAVIDRTRRPRVLILVGLGVTGGGDAFWLIRNLRERYPAHATLGVGANADASSISRALFVGADGYVDKNVDPIEFLSALRRADAGEMVLAVPAHVTIGDIAVGIGRNRDLEVTLTAREREVLAAASEGLTAREIAGRLGVRERTVTTHLSRIYSKLGVGNRLSAIRIASRSGLVAASAE